MDCPYCNSPAVFMSSKEFYGRDYGSSLYACKPCDARIGTHQNTKRALGTMANQELRELRMQVHAVFDPLWKSGKLTRSKAYIVLQELMELSSKEAHIGMFNEDRCRLALEKLRDYEPPKNSTHAFKNRGHFCNYCRKILYSKEPRYSHYIINPSIWYVWKNPEYMETFLESIKRLQPTNLGDKKTRFNNDLVEIVKRYEDKEGYGKKK